MIKGIWNYSILKYKTPLVLEENDIPFEIWEKDGEVEYRISLDDLSLKEIHFLRKEFNISDKVKITDYNYLILYY